MTSPALPVGTWNVITNLHAADLNVTNVDDQGNVTGTIQTSASATYDISGTWNAATNELSFRYYVLVQLVPVAGAEGSLEAKFRPPEFEEVVQYQGYLFQGAGSGLFGQPPGPVSVPPPYNIMLAGTFSYSLLVGEPVFIGGWVARSTTQTSA
jgi:hypothetical protein